MVIFSRFGHVFYVVLHDCIRTKLKWIFCGLFKIFFFFITTAYPEHSSRVSRPPHSLSDSAWASVFLHRYVWTASPPWGSFSGCQDRGKKAHSPKRTESKVFNGLVSKGRFWPPETPASHSSRSWLCATPRTRFHALLVPFLPLECALTPGADCSLPTLPSSRILLWSTWEKHLSWVLRPPRFPCSPGPRTGCSLAVSPQLSSPWGQW